MTLADRRPLTWAATLGVGAYASGFLATYAWLGGQVGTMANEVTAHVEFSTAETTVVSDPTLAALVGDGGPSATTWAGWLFHSAHFVPLDVTNPAVRFGTGSVPNLVLAAEGSLVTLVLLLPPVLLALAGGLASLGRSGPTAGVLPTGARRGATVAVGYLPLAVAGALVFVAEPSIWRRGAVGPDLLASVLLMGVAYPVVFGGVGGWLRGALVDAAEDADRPDDHPAPP